MKFNSEVEKHFVDQPSKEKKKWQIALRRYVLDRNPSRFYAPFFGVDIETFRNWIEAQFEGELNWENFGKLWQFEHILPTSCFSNTNDDLRLCWNFTNIIVAADGLKNTPDILSAKVYFQHLFDKTGYERCRLMLEKIREIEADQKMDRQLSFCIQNSSDINSMSAFDESDFERLNQGGLLKDIILEKQILSKFGS